MSWTSSAGRRPKPGANSNIPATPDGLYGRRRYAAVAAISLGTVLTTISGPIVNVALPTMARDLHVAPSAAVLVVTVYQLVLMMALLPMSAFGQRIGHRALFQYGQAIFVAATLLSFFAQNLPLLLLIRGLQAVGAAAAMSVSSALIRSIYPSAMLGRGLSFNTLIAAGFGTLAPTVGGTILAVASWPWLFAALVPFGIVSIIIGQKSLPDSTTRREAFDWLGAMMCAATFGLAISGLALATGPDAPAFAGALVVFGVALGVIFVRRERHQPRPVLPVDLLRQGDIALSSLGLLASFLSSMLVLLTLAFRLQQHYHFSPPAVGAVLALWPLVMMFTAPTSGMLSDRVPAALLGGIGMVFAVAGLLSLAFLPPVLDHFTMLWRIGLCGLGFGMFNSPNSRLLIAAAPIERAAAAGALTTTIRGAGQTLGATIVAALLATGTGTGPAPALIAAALAAIAGICSFAVLRLPAHNPTLVEIAKP